MGQYSSNVRREDVKKRNRRQRMDQDHRLSAAFHTCDRLLERYGVCIRPRQLELALRERGRHVGETLQGERVIEVEIQGKTVYVVEKPGLGAVTALKPTMVEENFCRQRLNYEQNRERQIMAEILERLAG